MQIAIFGTLIFMLFYVLWERGEREEGGVRGASYEQMLDSYGKLSSDYEKESMFKVNLEGKVSRYYSLSEITSKASSITGEDELYEFMAVKAFQLIGYGRSSILAIGKKGDLIVKAVSGFSQKQKDGVGGTSDTPHVSDAIYQRVIKKFSPVFVKNLSLDRRFSSSYGKEEGSIICVPLVKRAASGKPEEVTTMLEVRSPVPDSFKLDDLRLLEVIADLLTISLENIRLYQRTQELSIRDGLTHLYLHRYFQERLVEEMKRSSFYKLKLSLLMADIDYFKKCNDTHGHTFGDSVLRQVANLISAAVRKIDFVARYGGDEFAVILPETPSKGAMVVAERIRKSVEGHTFRANGQDVHIAISIGLASYPGDGLTTKDELVGKADEALLTAKKTGRNKVCG